MNQQFNLVKCVSSCLSKYVSSSPQKLQCLGGVGDPRLFIERSVIERNIINVFIIEVHQECLIVEVWILSDCTGLK